VPVVDPVAWRLVIEGEGLRHLELSLEDLRTKFQKHTLAVTLQCAGGRAGWGVN
jgi:sulfite oxidase